MDECANISASDAAALRQAAILLQQADSPLIRLAGMTARAGGRLVRTLRPSRGRELPPPLRNALLGMLRRFQSGALLGLGARPVERRRWLPSAVAVASGASSGFIGLPGLVWDLPVTTGVIMRTVADVARTFPDEDIASPDTRRACLEVLALGSPLPDDDAAEYGYWAARAGLSHAGIELLLRSVASRFGVALSSKLTTQAVPLLGAAAGAALNAAFTDYYRQMARVHFTLRAVERRVADPAAVRRCFNALVREARAAST